MKGYKNLILSNWNLYKNSLYKFSFTVYVTDLDPDSPVELAVGIIL